MRPDNSSLIGVDWGTSRLRAFRIGSAGQILERRRSNCGIGSLAAGDFDAALSEVVAGWPSGVPILMCGMVGSRQGWQEVAYRHCPAGARDLAASLSPIATCVGPAWIVGGLSTMQHEPAAQGRPARTRYDVMRGEETLVVGVASTVRDALVIMPGTHSKWAVIQSGSIERFRTSMTGEMYELLRKHSILGRLMPDDQVGRHDEGAFREGVQLALDEPALLHSLFSVRTQALFSQKPHASLNAYLSGILIGSEILGEARQVSRHGSTIVIAGPELGRLYHSALVATGFDDIGVVDAETAVAQGLWILWQLQGATS
jgi:2-dehydro-3-deoxygalactonokinase